MYKFSVNGINMDDYSEVCDTPLAPDQITAIGPLGIDYLDPKDDPRMKLA